VCVADHQSGAQSGQMRRNAPEGLLWGANSNNLRPNTSQTRSRAKRSNLSRWAPLFSLAGRPMNQFDANLAAIKTFGSSSHSNPFSLAKSASYLELIGLRWQPTSCGLLLPIG